MVYIELWNVTPPDFDIKQAEARGIKGRQPRVLKVIFVVCHGGFNERTVFIEFGTFQNPPAFVVSVQRFAFCSHFLYLSFNLETLKRMLLEGFSFITPGVP